MQLIECLKKMRFKSIEIFNLFLYYYNQFDYPYIDLFELNRKSKTYKIHSILYENSNNISLLKTNNSLLHSR